MEDIHNLKPFLLIPFPTLALVGILALLAALGVLAWLLWRRFGPKRKPAAPPLVQTPALSARDIALRALAQLERSRHIEKEDSERFYLDLCQILRIYLQQRHTVPATAFTSQEIRQLLHRRNQESPPLVALWERSLLAEFAGSRFSQRELISDLEQARQFIQADS